MRYGAIERKSQREKFRLFPPFDGKKATEQKASGSTLFFEKCLQKHASPLI